MNQDKPITLINGWVLVPRNDYLSLWHPSGAVDDYRFRQVNQIGQFTVTGIGLNGQAVSASLACPRHKALFQIGSLSVRCVWCKERLGWYCPVSEDDLCHYEDSEYCIHCGEPEERK